MKPEELYPDGVDPEKQYPDGVDPEKQYPDGVDPEESYRSGVLEHPWEEPHPCGQMEAQAGLKEPPQEEQY